MSSVPPMSNVSDQRVVAEDAVDRLLKSLSKGLGFSLDDPNFEDTPKRVAKSWGEILRGYQEDPAEILSKSFPNDGYNQMIVVKDIKFFSVCAHHMLPFYGNIAVGYIPGKISDHGKMSADECERLCMTPPPREGRVVGLSKIARVCHTFARRFQLQERMTQQIADALEEHLKPSGVAVFVYDSIHLCMHMRGVEESHSTMDTNVLRGEFMTDPAVRDEFFRMVGR